MKKLYIILFSFFGIISVNSSQAQLEYKDVAHIFYSRCTSCHHENQQAPPMLNYFETTSLSYAMLGDLTSNRMPPYPPDTSYTRFQHEHIITAQEKADLISWINSGELAGDTTLAPPAPTYPPFQLYGTPDLVLRTGTFTSNGGGADAYNCFSIPTGLTQDRILRAYEIVPGNIPIVHHVVVNIDSMGTTTSDLSGGCYTISGDVGIGGYAPGAPPTVFPGQAPLKAGIRIRAGSKLVLQIHYPAGTAGQIDSTKIRLYFYPVGTTNVRQMYASVPLQNWSLTTLANTTHTYTANYYVPWPISVFAAFPHSHKVCTSLVNYAYMATDTIPLIRINNWRFDWQGYYTYRNMVKVPNGYTLFSSHFYDNTTNNLNNPHSPPQNIYAGTSTTDEMLFDSFQWMIYQTGDELIDVAAIMANDPLLNGVNEIAKTDLISNVYPNPSSDKLNIYLSKKSDYKITISTIEGKNVLSSKTNEDYSQLDVKGISSGLYILEAKDTKSGEHFSKKVIITR